MPFIIGIKGVMLLAKTTEQCYCQKCNRTMNASEFYQSNNIEKYPTKYLNQCKRCLTMHVDNWNPDTYLWILQECDVPYVPEEWFRLLERYGADRSKVTGMTILGRYLSKMKLNQWNKFRWKDSNYLQEMANHRMQDAMKRQGFDVQAITDATERASMDIPEKLEIPEEVLQPLTLEERANRRTGDAPPPAPDQFVTFFDSTSGQQDEDDGLAAQLTEEDKMMLRVKWGKTYRPEEWIQLEKLYNEMMESYDIQSAGHIDTLKMICKTSLKSNQLLDIGDVDGAQKMIKMYDMLMKSGKFQAVQNKTENGNAVDSISELVMLCEKDGFFPRYYTDGPQDKVDRTLQDLQNYTRQLVTEEMNLGNLIESAVKQIQADKEKEAMQDAEAANDDDVFEAELFADNKKAFMNDEDFKELQDFIEEEEMSDEEYFRTLESKNEEMV